MSKKDIRKIEEYEVTNSFKIANKELVMGEDMKNKDGNHYMTCYVGNNGFFEYYDEAVVSNNYLEIVEEFANRVKSEVSRVSELMKAENQPLNLITADMCSRDCFAENLEDKILVVKADVLLPEYRTDTHQIIRCTGGNGANPNAMGNAVFCYQPFNKSDHRFERYEILGELKPEFYPEWLVDVLQCEQAMKNPNTFQYGEYHFLPVGKLPKNEPIYRTSQYCHSDKNIRMWTELYEGVYGKAKTIYSHKDFYEASRNSKCDVFKCLENRKLYLPAENELFEYTGKFIKHKEPEKTAQQPKKKNKSQKERER